MASKKNSPESPVSAIVKNIGEVILNGIKDNIVSVLKEKIHRIEVNVFKTMFGFLVFVWGIFFLFVSLIFFLHIYIGLDYAQAFFGIGIVSVIVGIIIKYIKY